MKSAATRKLSLGASKTHHQTAFTDHLIRHVASNSPEKIAEWVSGTAGARGISRRCRPIDTFARAVSRLSDGTTELDPTEELLIVLARAGVISGYQRGLLHVSHVR